MMKRAASSAVLLAVLIGAVIYGRAHGAAILAALTSVLTLREFYALVEQMGLKPMRELGMTLGALIVLGAFYLPVIEPISLLHGGGDMLLLSVIGIGFATLFTAPFRRILPTFAATVIGLVLVAMPLQFLIAVIPLCHDEGQGLLTGLWIVLAAKSADVGALIAGTRFGRTPFFPKLSPRKTWEGVGGAVMLTILVSLVYVGSLGESLPTELGLLHAVILAVLLALAAIVGDLFESALKREAALKDSGHLVPGIGGVYDLVDSLLFAAPIGYLYVKYVLFGG